MAPVSPVPETRFFTTELVIRFFAFKQKSDGLSKGHDQYGRRKYDSSARDMNPTQPESDAFFCQENASSMPGSFLIYSWHTQRDCDGTGMFVLKPCKTRSVRPPGGDDGH